MTRRAATLAFDAAEGLLAVLATSRPLAALAAAGALGRARNQLSRRWPSPHEVLVLFPELAPAAAARVAARIGGLEARNRLAAELLRRAGLPPLRSLLRPLPAGFAAFRPPFILGTFHAGAVHALGPALERLPAPVLAFRHGPLFAAEPGLRVETTEGDEQRRAAAFQRALAHLEGGGCVAMALDVAPGPAIQVPCLGRTLTLARGPFALVRLAGAPLVPLLARWRRGGVEVLVGEPLAVGTAPDAEGALAAAAARWLEDYLRASPAELGLGLLRALLGSGLTRVDGRR